MESYEISVKIIQKSHKVIINLESLQRNDCI